MIAATDLERREVHDAGRLVALEYVLDRLAVCALAGLERNIPKILALQHKAKTPGPEAAVHRDDAVAGLPQDPKGQGADAAQRARDREALGNHNRVS